MKELVLVYYAAIVVVTVGFLAFFMPEPRRPTAAECGVSEIAPDMSTRDREVCRQLRQHRHRM
jgi:hypothetical protein